MLEDPTVRTDHVEPLQPDSVTQRPQGWITSFLKENPSDAEELSAQGILDEATYLDREAELKGSVRGRSGRFRAHYLAGANCTDPCKLAQAAPPWLAEREITSILLPARPRKFFRSINIKTVRDLADWSIVALLRQPYFGRQSINDTLHALTAALKEGPPRAASVVTIPKPSSRQLEHWPLHGKHIVNLESRSWITSFLKENPSDAEELSAQGILDEATYLDREAELKGSVRGRSGRFRAHYLAGANCTDPCKLAQAAPPWLAEREITSILLPVRPRNVFRRINIKTVRDLADWSGATLLSQPNYGQQSLIDTVHALLAALNEGPPRAASAEPIPQCRSLLADFRRTLLSLEDRERDVLVRRLGFETSQQTLQNLAERHGVSRERIRQIAARAVEKWKRMSTWDDILERKVSRLVIGREYPLPVAGVDAVDKWFDGVSSHLTFFRNLVNVQGNDRINVIRIDNLDYFSLITKKAWESTISEAAELLSSGVGLEWSEENARLLVHGLLPDTASEFGRVLWEESSRICHFRRAQDGSRVLTGYGRGTDQLVRAILAESDSPLHFKEIARRVNSRAGKNLRLATVHRAAQEVGYLVARGTYGIACHLPISDVQMSQIRIEAEAIVYSEASSRQWHTSEILLETSDRMGGRIENLDKYLLEIVLAGSSKLRSLKKMTWIAATAETDNQSRIEIHKAVVAIVQAAGHPLSAGEIKKRLTPERGVNGPLQIYPRDPLIRVQPSRWGISGRDAPIS